MIAAPAWARLSVAALSGVLALWAVVGAILSLALPGTSVWTMFGFELVIAVAGVLGLLTGLGHFKQAPALAIACVAGTVFVGSFLGYQGAAGRLGDLSLKPWVMGRLVLAVTLGLIAAVVVLVRHRQSLSSLIRGVAFGALPGFVAMMLGLSALGYGRAAPTPPPGPEGESANLVAAPAARQPAWLDSAVRQFMGMGLLRPAKGGMEAGRVVLVTVLGLLLIGLTSAGVHYVIRAFQLGAFPEPGAAPGGGGGAVGAGTSAA